MIGMKLQECTYDDQVILKFKKNANMFELVMNRY